jgi:lipid A 3-O-deacylase
MKIFNIFFVCGSYCFLLLAFVLSANVSKAEEVEFSLKNNNKSWEVLVGYGVTHTDLGKTEAHVETIDFVIGYEKFLTQVIGASLLKGRHSLVIELPVHFVIDPREDPMIGLNFLARWTFESDDRIKPYIFGGGGPVYTEADIPGLGSNINGNWQLGVGLKFSSPESHDVVVEYRFHHISNMGTKDPNDPLNSSKILVGLRF